MAKPGPGVCAKQLSLPVSVGQAEPKVGSQKSEDPRHSGARPDYGTAAVRQFSHLVLSHSQPDKVSSRPRRRPARPIRMSRELSFRHGATPADPAPLHREEPSVVT